MRRPTWRSRPYLGKRWNHNLHYHPVILNAVPDGSTRALDVGCGAGILARDLRRLVPQVTGIDLDQTSIDLARHYDHGADIEYVLGDFLTHPFEPASFDVIASVAALHHMDATAALGRMRDLLRVGGTLAIVGLARSEFPADLPFDLAGIVATRFHRLTKTYWKHPSPTVWPPPDTFTETRRLIARILPGAHYRRHVLWRYSLTWTKPRSGVAEFDMRAAHRHPNDSVVELGDNRCDQAAWRPRMA